MSVASATVPAASLFHVLKNSEPLCHHKIVVSLLCLCCVSLIQCNKCWNMAVPLPTAWAPYEFAERDQHGSPNLLADDEEELLHQYPDVLLTLGNDLEQGVGKLFITTR